MRIEFEDSIKVYQDGNMWCALLGEDLQAGRACFADNPLAALQGLCFELGILNRKGAPPIPTAAPMEQRSPTITSFG